MKWVALVIVLIIGPYTFLRWHYRKPETAFEPYQDIKDRANTIRLLSAGFQRVALSTDRPADPSRETSNGAAITSAPGGLPTSLDGTLVEKPVLPSEILTVNAPRETNTLFAYGIEFTCGVTDNKHQLGEVYLYSREGQLYIVPEIEPLTGELLARNRNDAFRVTVPAGVLKPGSYEVMLIGERSSKAWTLLVK
jgi:hypothetical protein